MATLLLPPFLSSISAWPHQMLCSSFFPPFYCEFLTDCFPILISYQIYNVRFCISRHATDTYYPRCCYISLALPPLRQSLHYLYICFKSTLEYLKHYPSRVDIHIYMKISHKLSRRYFQLSLVFYAWFTWLTCNQLLIVWLTIMEKARLS